MLLISSLWLTLQDPVLAVAEPAKPAAEAPAAKPAAEAPPSEAPAAGGENAKAGPTKQDETPELPKCPDGRSAQETECIKPWMWRLQRHVRYRSSNRFHKLTGSIREARCATALCWWPDNFWGLEILAEAPLGASFALEPGRLGGFLDNNGFTVQLTAGIRMWTVWDYFSVSVYFSKLAFQSNDSAIRIPGYSYEHPTSSIRRPYPGVAVGLLADILWIAFDYNVLYNGNGSNRDPHFGENSRLMSAWTVSIALAPITLGRSIGAAAARKK